MPTIQAPTRKNPKPNPRTQTRRAPFVINSVSIPEPAPAPVPVSKPAHPEVCLNGDLFESDTEYFKQIPGYWESLIEAAKEPLGEGVIYDPETFWEDVKCGRWK